MMNSSLVSVGVNTHDGAPGVGWGRVLQTSSERGLGGAWREGSQWFHPRPG